MNYPRILTLPETRRLLLASWGKARTARELSDATGIPIARCYRLLRRLHVLDLIHVEGVSVPGRGRAKLLFGSRLPGMEIFVEGTRIRGRVRRPSISEPS